MVAFGDLLHSNSSIIAAVSKVRVKKKHRREKSKTSFPCLGDDHAGCRHQGLISPLYSHIVSQPPYVMSSPHQKRGQGSA